MSVGTTLVTLLNEMAELDPYAAEQMVKQSWACNQALAEHPTILVNQTGNMYMVRWLGVLNGFLARVELGDEILKATFYESKLVGFQVDKKETGVQHVQGHAD